MLSQAADYFGAQYARDRAKQERERALQRGVVGLTVSAYWVLQYLLGREVHAQPWFVAFLGIVLPALAFGYRRYLLSNPEGGVAIQYAFLVFDPIVIMSVLVQDPYTFAFLNPFLLVVIVRNGHPLRHSNDVLGVGRPRWWLCYVAV